MMRKKRKHIQFSKILTGIFAVFTLPLSAYVVVKCLNIAESAVRAGFTGALPYVTAIVGFVQAALVTVFGFYFDNSKKEKRYFYENIRDEGTGDGRDL